ncbi:MAG: LPS assembly lipoprotein LptE [Phycisphaerales bacterium]
MRRWAASVLGVLLVAVVGCAERPSRGYSFASPYDAQITTIAVPIFGNATQHAGVETMVTEAIIRRIQQQTPWRVTDLDTADVVLEGAIGGVRLVRLSNQTGVGLVQEQAVQIVVSFELIDNRQGGALVSRRGFAALASFVPAAPTSERLSVGYREAAEALATDLVDELGNAW